MTPSRLVIAIALGAVLTGACSADRASVLAPEVVVAAPILLNGNALIATTVGAPLAYDASKGGTVFSDPALKGLTYSIALSGTTTGLSSNGPTLTGTPSSPGIATITVTATDGLGRTIADRFAVVVFANGLLMPSLPVVSYSYSDATAPLPASFTAVVNALSVASTDNTPATNPTTNAGATLGRVLFYDPRLSADDGTACASCHVQALGFSDALPKSVGFAGGLTDRHSPTLANARFYKRGRFFWDERAASLEAQVVAPIQNATEMGMTLDGVVLKLSATPYYATLFTSAFGSPVITSERMAFALAQYVRSLVPTGSRYDRAFTAAGAPNFAATLTVQEQAGELLFRTAGCASCHTTVAQVSDAVHDIGLDALPTDTGAGRGAFKSPSLRNVAVRTHFMHDGRFTTLQQVIDFHDAGVQPSPSLDAQLKAPDGTPKRLGLSAAQKASLVAFLETLTDSAFLTAGRFSNPFAITAPPPPPPVAGTAVSIQGNAYHPPLVTVAPGTIITFTNLDNSRHSASFSTPGIASTAIFSSGSRTVAMPSATGTYPYQCAIHGAAMRGTVVVR